MVELAPKLQAWFNVSLLVLVFTSVIWVPSGIEVAYCWPEITNLTELEGVGILVTLFNTTVVEFTV